MAQKIRNIKKIIRGRSAIDGAGVRLVRLFGGNDVRDFDPFLLLDAFDSRNPDDYLRGFPWHPHRGIETITYLIQGDLEHGDSLGNSGSILDGDCQWMTAGSGIIHQEMPQVADRLWGCQIWLNLPAKDKMSEPAYNDILDKDVPVIEEDQARVHIIAGTYLEHKGAFEGKYVSPLYLDVELNPDAEWSLETEPGHTLFIYILAGDAKFEGDRLVPEKSVVLFEQGQRFWVQAGDAGARFLLWSAPPLGEPIAWGGPIVMNTQEELAQAFKDLREDTFLKVSGK